ncbi:hypothetical protein ACOBQX_14375 [Actinokineospora sp. G85]|uniref:hypothetical protein n=1 Tax=Actinokineospora sp. G85 TaxID=3406626 RepID=UPI003C7155A0
MTTVVTVTREELEARRKQILIRRSVTLEQFANRAAQGQLVGDEWDDWNTLEEVTFLLGE